jgi:hypothetical protein
VDTYEEHLGPLTHVREVKQLDVPTLAISRQRAPERLLGVRASSESIVSPDSAWPRSPATPTSKSSSMLDAKIASERDAFEKRK